MKRLLLIALLLGLSAVVPRTASPFEQAVSVGYGLAAYNDGLHAGRVEGGKNYDFFQFTYLIERSCTDHHPLSVFAEPFASSVVQPHEGVDFGFYTGLRYCLLNADNRGFFFTAGTGLVYTTTYFKEQGTHLDFTSRPA